MSLAKRLGRKPREVADAIVAAIDLTGIAARPEIAGPGFVNVRLDDGYLARLVGEAAADHARLGIAPATRRDTVVVDYSGPNVAKEMHVGHLRSTVIGDALARTLAFEGHDVIRQNHVGDWGTQFGMLIELLIERAGRTPGRDPETLLGPGTDLTATYREATARDASDPDFARRARERVVKLQGGDPETLRSWKALVDLSAAQFQAVYDRLGVALGTADIRGESAYNDRLPAVVAELREGPRARERGRALRLPRRLHGQGRRPAATHRPEVGRRLSLRDDRPRGAALPGARAARAPDRVRDRRAPAPALPDGLRGRARAGWIGEVRRARSTSSSDRCSARTESPSRPAAARPFG